MSTVEHWNAQLGLHRGFLHDRVRNAAFHAAITQTVKPGMRVLDLGSGSGIWACVAAKAGASYVAAVEFSDLALEARRTVTRNGLANIVAVIHDDVRNIRMNDFDVVIHELVGGLVWEEDMIALTAHAQTLLAPGGVLLPGTVHLSLCPWFVPGDRPRRADWSPVCSIDVAHMYESELAQWRAQRRATCVHGLPLDGQRAAPTRVYTAHLGIEREPLPPELRFEFVATRDGVASGLAGFMDIELAPGCAIRTSPWDPPTNWGQLYVPAEEPLVLEAGTRYEARMRPALSKSGWNIDWHSLVPTRHFFH
jgi:protein arginine N-methyltransferase 1